VLNVELTWDEVEKASDRAYRQLAQKYNVPGFRRGHAPRSMIERMLGKDAVYHEGLDDLIESSYRSAITENDLRPLAQPEVETPELEIGQPYTFTAKVPVLAPVKLGDYQAVRVPLPETTVSDEDVEKVLQQLRQDQAMWLPVERPAELGDQVTVDLKLTVGERTVSDLHDNEFELTGERVGIFSGMDQHIVGMSEGESKTFTTTIPEDYANTEIAGQEAHYEVTVKGVKHREMPELDDELAKTVGDFQTTEELTKAVREQLASQKENEGRRTQRENAIKAVTDEAEVEIHPVLVQDELDTMMRETDRMLSQSRLSLSQYLEITNKSEEEYRQDLEPEARERVKRDLVLDAVADAESFSAGDAEIASWLEALNAMGGGKRMRLNQLSSGQKANIAARIKRDKAAARLVEIASQEQSPSGAAPVSAATEDAAAAEDTEAGARAAAAAAGETSEPTKPSEPTKTTKSTKTPAAAAETTESASEPAPEEIMTEPQANLPAPAETDV
jgi:trigger factor